MISATSGTMPKSKKVSKPKSRAKKETLGAASQTAFWRGRMWRICKLSDEEADVIMPEKCGALSVDSGVILIRESLEAETAIMTVLHEAGHAMYPEWDIEPTDQSKSELGVFERDLKAFLEAFGVDLSPLVQF